jgi:hypothetical protein
VSNLFDGSRESAPRGGLTNAEARAIYEQQAQLQKEKEDLETTRKLLYALFASVEESEVTANAEGEAQ